MRSVSMTERIEGGVSGGIERSERDNEAWIRRALMEAAAQGMSLHTVLMIGDAVVPEGITYEEIVAHRFDLLREGLVTLDSSYRSHLSEAGFAELEKE